MLVSHLAGLRSARRVPQLLNHSYDPSYLTRNILSGTVVRYISAKYRTTLGENAITKISEEVQSALSIHGKGPRKPVVALETAIYTHGFPKPDNLALAKEVEQAVRDNGAVPATIGILNGKIIIGMSPEELEELANSAGNENTVKCSVRDLSYLTGLGPDLKLNGGTTIAATLFLCRRFGIRVFATGGLGGVHREGENTMDVSTDLMQLGRGDTVLISSGMKAFLDYERSLEYLETNGVMVSTFGSRDTKVTLPGFFSVGSSTPSPFVVENVDEAAKIAAAQLELKVNSSVVFFNPVPKDKEIPREEIESIINEAVESAKQQGVTGKANTPFILNEIKNKTGGRTLEANRELILDNARVGAQLATKLHELIPDTLKSAKAALRQLKAERKAAQEGRTAGQDPESVSKSKKGKTEKSDRAE